MGGRSGAFGLRRGVRRARSDGDDGRVDFFWSQGRDGTDGALAGPCWTYTTTIPSPPRTEYRLSRTPPRSPQPQPRRPSSRSAGAMSEERGKGISLRKNKKRSDKSKKGGPPVISAPRQISAPMPVGLGAATLSSAQNSGRPSNESSRSGQRPPDAPRPRERPQRPGQDKTADLVKRRYSQKITQLPSDFGNMPMPDMPQIPSQYRDAPPSRDGRPPDGSDARSFKPDRRQLADDNLKPDQCKSSHPRRKQTLMSP